MPAIVLFGDSDNENSDAYLSAVQVREGRMSDEEIAALGGPDAGGIPSASIGSAGTVIQPPTIKPTLKVSRNGANLTISWEAAATGFTLESKASLSDAAWTPVAGAANSSATITLTGSAQFYRLRK